MERWLDDLARTLAVRRSRRQTLKLLAAGLGGLAASSVELGAARGAEQPAPAAALPPREQAGAVNYPPGWNLVGGPAGSTLAGATGNLYSLQPGDSDYQVFPANTPLQPCWGYWAYFPSGGRLIPGTSRAGCAVGVVAGQWVMAGNASIAGPAPVDGADQVLTYTPAGGYQPAAAIPVGAGAWVFASAAVAVEAPPAAAPAGQPSQAAPPVQAAPAPQPTQAPVNAQSSGSTCCKHCTTGKPCGNTCIAARDTCHVGAGCAC